MEIAEEMAPEGGRRGQKRRGEDLEDLYRSEVPDPGSMDEPLVIFQRGGSSGSGGANPVPEPMQDLPKAMPKSLGRKSLALGSSKRSSMTTA